MREHVALQRLVVRLLFDPELVTSYNANPEQVAGGLNLPEGSQQWLLSIDPRAWGIDTMRRSRTLTALLEEFPATAALSFQEPDASSRLDRFFSHDAFHPTIQARGALAPAFGAWWIREARDDRFPAGTGAIATIETTIAELRRAVSPEYGVSPSLETGQVMLHPGVGLLSMPEGSLDLYAHVLAAMGADRALEPVVNGDVRLGDVPALNLKREESLLLNPVGPGGGVGAISDALTALLRLTEMPISRDAFLQGMLELGAAPEDQEEILRDLIRDELLLEG